MNNYLTTNSNEELIRKEYLQQRHYQLQNELQQMAQELPKYDKMSSNLIFFIQNGLNCVHS